MLPAQTDVLIIGAGPGGLQLAHELRRARIDHLVLDAAEAPGSFFRTFPRHRRLISVNKPNVGTDAGNALRFDWNSLLTTDPALRFTRYSADYFPPADAMVGYLADCASRLQLEIHHGCKVTAIERVDGRFVVAVAIDGGGAVGGGEETVDARRVVVATGVVAHDPTIPGIEHTERYADFATDPAGFRDARVLIIGKGNSGFETATSLIPTAATIHLVSPTPVRFAWATHYVGHLRAINNELLDTYHLKSGNAVLDAEVTGIRRDQWGYDVDLVYTHASGQHVTYRYDRVIAATGFRFDPSPLAGLAPERCKDGRLPDMTADYRSVSVPDLYYAGTLMQARDHGKTASGFIHGFRYNIRFLAKVLRSTDGTPAADAEVPADAATLADFVVARLNESDALFLQPGYLADAFVAGRGPAQRLGLYTGVPLDWLREGGLGSGWRLAVTLEYGPPAPDPFNVKRSPDPGYAKVTPYLHPVLRLLHGDTDVERLDLLEDVENRYRPEHYLPHLLPFLEATLSSLSAANAR